MLRFLSKLKNKVKFFILESLPRQLRGCAYCFVQEMLRCMRILLFFIKELFGFLVYFIRGCFKVLLHLIQKGLLGGSLYLVQKCRYMLRHFRTRFREMLLYLRMEFSESWLCNKFIVAIFFKKYFLFEVVQAVNEGFPEFKLIKKEEQPSVLRGNYSVYDSVGHVSFLESAWVCLPDAYVVLISNVYVFPCTSFVRKGRRLFYDYRRLILDNDALDKHSYYLKMIGRFEDPSLLLKRYSVSDDIIPCGVSILEDFQYNYYHWLLEALPKLSLLEGGGEYLDYPLLVPDSLPVQFYEALRLVNSVNRKVIRLAHNKFHKVDTMVYITNLSYTNEIRHRVPVRGDYCIAPKAVDFLRDKCQMHFVKGAPQKLLYLDRLNHTRGLLNSEAVKQMMLNLGFEIVDCSTLTFIEQIQLFSQARVIVGPTGASFTNLVFVQSSAKGLIFFPGGFCDCYDIFLSIAQARNIDMSVLRGCPTDFNHIHSAYNVDVSVLESLVRELIAI